MQRPQSPEALEAGQYELRGLDRINVVLGKNGCGKSTLMKVVEQQLPTRGQKRYITPERAGILTYEPGIENNLANDKNWLSQSRRVNQYAQFRQQSMAQFRRLELAVLRSGEGKSVVDFNPYIDRLNGLLDNIDIERNETTFDIYSTRNGDRVAVPASEISSGEAELISLGIEALAFAESLDRDLENYLILDEPDVHLHPDLQSRLMRFLVGLVDEYGFRVLMATHSTAILGALADVAGTRVCFMLARETALDFEEITGALRSVLPVFGAHPLSNIFNEAPVLLVEGEDDERVWQQAVRTAGGALRVYPVAVEDGVSGMNDFEQEVRRIIGAVYEDAIGYSLRDRDETTGEIDDEPPVRRMKLGCRAAENLILSDDVLAAVRLTPIQLKERIEAWLTSNADHQDAAAMAAFRDGGFDRKGADLKVIRNILTGMILNSNKSWEVLAGQAIGRLAKSGAAPWPPPPHSLQSYLGDKAVANLLRASSER